MGAVMTGATALAGVLVLRFVRTSEPVPVPA
jgi:hypothetical protein